MNYNTFVFTKVGVIWFYNKMGFFVFYFEISHNALFKNIVVISYEPLECIVKIQYI